MVNVPDDHNYFALSPRAVARRLQRVDNMFALGMRALFFAIPLVFWLFGPNFLLISPVGLVMALYHLDRSDEEEDKLGTEVLSMSLADASRLESTAKIAK